MVHQCAVRGQYGAGWIGGKKVRAYREEDKLRHAIAGGPM
jgi:glucose-6-phosphate 1-dehydrogenase